MNVWVNNIDNYLQKKNLNPKNYSDSVFSEYFIYAVLRAAVFSDFKYYQQPQHFHHHYSHLISINDCIFFVVVIIIIK